MGIMSRLRRPKQAEPPAPRTRREAEDQLIEVAHRVVPPATELTHFFVCSGNPSLIEAYHELFRVGTPAYGGSAALYRADEGVMSGRQDQASASALAFNGRRAMGSSQDDVAAVADVIQAMRRESPSGRVFVAYAAVGPTGVDWVHEVYSTLLDQAMGQGILPFHMFWTTDAGAAGFLRESFSVVSAV
jgi:hypothetical protein